MSAKLPRAQRRFRARRHVRRIASVICPRHTAHPNGSRTNERETAARAAPLSDAPPRWRRGLGSFTPALCAPKQKTHEWARRFRTRSAALGRAATLAVPLRLFPPWHTARPNGSRTNERETSARAAPLSGAPPRWQFGPRFFFLGTLRAHLEDTQKSPNGSRVGSAASVSFPRRTAH